MSLAVNFHILNFEKKVRGELPSRPRVAALGSFDGLHTGHRRLLEVVTEDARSRSGSAIVVSFYPHPTIVLGKVRERPPILTVRQRARILSALGVSALVMVRFTEALSKLSAAEFIDKILVNSLDIDTLYVGPDAAFGKGREANVDDIRLLLEARGRSLQVVSHLLNDGDKIGSRMIRAQIGAGDVGTAQRLLAAPVTVEGRVVRGEGRGKKISIPTANIATLQLLPAHGVYAGIIKISADNYPAVINVGRRPTFSGVEVTVEAHLLNYRGGDFYGRRVALEFHYHIRGEQKFSGAEALVKQIHLDIERASTLLGV